MSAARREPLLVDLVGRPWAWVGLMAVLGGAPLLSGLTRTPPGPVPLAPVRPAFSLLDERGAAFTEANLPGHVWVVAFVDPACVGCVERVHEATATLEHRTRNLWPMFGLLTVALAPALPSKTAAPQSFRVLTGPQASALASRLAQGDAREVQALVQGRRLAVLDAHARLRGLHDNDSAGLDRLVRDLSLLANRGD